MIHYPVAFALLLHVLLWGAGGAMLAVPRPWWRLWPVLIAPVGLALQSAVVWYGALAGLRGTNAYALASEVLPLALLGVALWRHGLRAAWVDLSRFGIVWALMTGCLCLLVLPVAIASRSLTTLSLGSCDAADYAAGARVLMEFAKTDREGFLGLTEVVRIASVDNFFDYWIRLNHFTPSALIALNGSVLGCAPHELTTLFVAVLLASTLPVVFWSSRAILGYSGGVSVIVAGLFGVSPILWYAVAHVSPGQLLAAQAVVLLNWAGVSLWRGRLSVKRVLQFTPVLLVGYWLILGAYNFFLLLCLVPAVAYAGGLALWRGEWLRMVRWGLTMLAPLLLCGGLFFERVAGMAERFSLLQTYDFGWRIPAFAAEGWLGMVSGPGLEPWDFFGLRWVLSACVVGVLGWAVLRSVAERRRAVWMAGAIVLPVLAGYFFLQWRGAKLGTNASYDAYKLFAVFYPLLLPAFCWWVTLRRSRRLHEWFFVVGVMGAVIAFNVIACGVCIWKMSRPPLIVDGELRQLRQVEAMADVKSVNLRIPDMWSRLWAHVFLLRKAQYFETHTYEGRLNTPLRGDWDIEGGVVKLDLPGAARRPVGNRFALLDTRHPAFVRASLGDGWFPEEYVPGSGERWAWTQGEAVLRIDNPHAYPVALATAIDGWSAGPRTVTLQGAGGASGERVAEGEASPAVSVGAQRGETKFPPVVAPPGTSTWVLRTPEPLTRVPDDPRALGVGVFRFTLTPRP